MQTGEVFTLECDNQDCGLRFPLLGSESEIAACPRCGASLHVAHRTHLGAEDREMVLNCPSGLEGFLDNIRSAWNVGSMFRSADGAGLDHLHLVGITPTPEGGKVPKTALGAESALEWSYAPNGLAAAQALQAKGKALWALELHPRAIPAAQAFERLPDTPIVLIVGNEKSGVDPGILAICDRIVYLPMQGVKRSYNVAVAFGIFAVLARMARERGGSFG
jgi:tRNA G18 (ribose-2'-O)-methylase SpoU